MGVEMRVLLLPQHNTFRPTTTALAGLIERLRTERWIAAPSAPWFAAMRFQNNQAAARSGAYAEGPGWCNQIPVPADDLPGWLAARGAPLKLTWPVESLHSSIHLRYPLSADAPLPLEDACYKLELWLANHLIEPISELFGPIDNTCPCGRSLEAPEDGSGALFCAGTILLRCPVCGSDFDPSTRLAELREPWSKPGEARQLAGGATLRFALAVDLGKGWPEGREWGIHPELVRLCEAHFNQPFHWLKDSD